MSIGQRVKDLRKSKGISQEVLAAAIGVDRPAISNWEREAVSPNADNVQRLAEYFNVSTDHFYSGDTSAEDYNIAESIREIRAISEVTLSVMAELLAKQTGQSSTVVKDQLKGLVKKRRNTSEPLQ